MRASAMEVQCGLATSKSIMQSYINSTKRSGSRIEKLDAAYTHHSVKHAASVAPVELYKVLLNPEQAGVRGRP